MYCTLRFAKHFEPQLSNTYFTIITDSFAHGEHQRCYIFRMYFPGSVALSIIGLNCQSSRSSRSFVDQYYDEVDSIERIGLGASKCPFLIAGCTPVHFLA